MFRGQNVNFWTVNCTSVGLKMCTLWVIKRGWPESTNEWRFNGKIIYKRRVSHCQSWLITGGYFWTNKVLICVKGLIWIGIGCASCTNKGEQLYVCLGSTLWWNFHLAFHFAKNKAQNHGFAQKCCNYTILYPSCQRPFPPQSIGKPYV